MLVALFFACHGATPQPPAEAEPATRLPKTWAVDCTGGGDFYTIQDAVAAARSGDTVSVEPCTYFGQVDFGGKTLRISSTGGAAVTTLLGTPGAATVKLKNGEGPGTTFSGFTIQGGGGVEDGVVDIEMSVLSLESSVVTGGTGAYAVHSRSGQLTVRDTSITGNVATTGFTVYGQRGGLVVIDSSVACDGNAVGVHTTHGQFLLDRATVSCNGGQSFFNEHAIGRIQRSNLVGLASHLGEIGNSDTAFFEDTVITGGILSTDGVVAVRNCVLTGGRIDLVNSDDGSIIEGSVLRDGDCGLAGQSAGTVVRNNAWFGLTTDLCSGGTPVGFFGNVAADCQHTDPANGDWSLQGGSPCIDAGPSEATYNDVDGTPNDIGVFGGPMSQGGGW